MLSKTTVRVTVDLSQDMYRELSLLAVYSGRKKSHIIRHALQRVLRNMTMEWVHP